MFARSRRVAIELLTFSLQIIRDRLYESAATASTGAQPEWTTTRNMHPRTRHDDGRSTALATLREAILSLKSHPGARLVERELVARCLASAGPACGAALQSLESESLVVRGKRGVFTVAAALGGGGAADLRGAGRIGTRHGPAASSNVPARIRSPPSAPPSPVPKPRCGRNASAYVEALTQHSTTCCWPAAATTSRAASWKRWIARITYLRHLTTQRARRCPATAHRRAAA